MHCFAWSPEQVCVCTNSVCANVCMFVHTSVCINECTNIVYMCVHVCTKCVQTLWACKCMHSCVHKHCVDMCALCVRTLCVRANVCIHVCANIVYMHVRVYIVCANIVCVHVCTLCACIVCACVHLCVRTCVCTRVCEHSVCRHVHHTCLVRANIVCVHECALIGVL